MDDIDSIVRNHPLACGACNKCCRKNPGVLLFPELGDDPSLYDTYAELVDGRQLVKAKPNGDCTYLDLEKGCTIYEKRPRVCRSYDCRSDYITWVAHPREERRALMKSGRLNSGVQKEGRLRLKKILDLKKNLDGDTRPASAD